MRQRLAEFLRGRYGPDDLGRFTNAACMVMLILSLLRPLKFLYLPALILLVLTVFRLLSRNYAARSRENAWFLRTKGAVTHGFSGFVMRTVGSGRFSRRTPNLIFACPSCGQKIRVPKGRGKIEITCSRCRTSFRKRT